MCCNWMYVNSSYKIIPFLNVMTFSHAYNKNPFYYIRGSNCILFPPPEIARLFKIKGNQEHPVVIIGHCREQVVVQTSVLSHLLTHFKMLPDGEQVTILANDTNSQEEENF